MIKMKYNAISKWESKVGLFYNIIFICNKLSWESVGYSYWEVYSG